MALKSTRNRSHFRIVREVEAIGGNVQASASREQTGNTFDALKTYVHEMVELLIDCVRNPVFLDWEVNEELLKVKAEINETSKNPQDLLLEAIHSAGFIGALANPLLGHELAINRLNGTVLEEFVADNYTAPRIVLAAKVFEHEEFLSIAEPLLSDLPSVPYLEESKSVYTGGDYRCQSESGVCIVNWNLVLVLSVTSAKFLSLISLECPDDPFCSWLSTSWWLAYVEGGNDFDCSSDLHVLNKYPQVHSISSFNYIYNNTGVFGVQVTTGSDFASQAIDIAVDELLAVATPGQVDQVQLDRAKQVTKSAILTNLESRACEFISNEKFSFQNYKLSFIPRSIAFPFLSFSLSFMLATYSWLTLNIRFFFFF